MKKSVVFIFLSFMLSSCILEETYKFNIRNDSNKELYFYRAYANSINVYPDTLLFEQFALTHINPLSTFHLGGFQKIDEKINEIPSDTLSIYFFDNDTLENFSWETICDEYKVLKRYDLSLKDIQLLDYEIPYPPTSTMKDMRMYPPYKD